MNRLEIIGLSKVYGKKRANDKIDLVLEDGLYGLLGPNGAGKTTLMKQIMTLSKPSEGKILYNGEDIHGMDGRYRDLIGYLPQEFGAYDRFSAIEFLRYCAAIKGIDKAEAKKRIDELLKLVGLYDVRKKAVGKFSGGMKRRVGIAQCLLNDPKIMVLDEPTAGLDPQERARFKNLLSRISKDKIIILSTHIISDIESIAKETIMIKNGRLLMKKSNDDILSNMDGKVYEIRAKDEEEIERISKRHKVINMKRTADYTQLRVISEKPPHFADVGHVNPRFEDVYMFYFDLEDAREV